jgi:hypothetical protein
MGGTTSNGLPYPTGTDLIMDGDNAIKALAESVDAKALGVTSGFQESPVTAGFILHSGFTALTGQVVRRNGYACLALRCTSLNAIGAGNITNIGVMTAPVGWRPWVITPLMVNDAGPGISLYINQSGTIALSVTAVAIGAATGLSIGGCYMLAPLAGGKPSPPDGEDGVQSVLPSNEEE